MDWSRAKTYLILTFLLLDLVLGYQFWKMRTEQASYVQSYAEQLKEVQELLSIQKWELRTEVPKLTPALGVLPVQYLPVSQEEWSKRLTGIDKLYLRSTGQVTVDFQNKGTQIVVDDPNPWEKVDSLLAGKVWPREQYHYDRIIKNGTGYGVVQYLQHYQNYPIFSAPLEVLFNENRVTQYQQTALEVTNEGGARKQVISALHALRSLSESMDKTDKSPDNRIISEIRLGYYSKPFNTETWYLFPVWRILTEKEVYYVNALTGEVELAR